MKTISVWTVIAMGVLAPVAALAQSSDAAYCSALAAKYEKYLNQDVPRGGPTAEPRSPQFVGAVQSGKPYRHRRP